PTSRNLSASDGLFATGVSYNAGTGEEALFRGYLMMNLQQSWDSELWSNAATASVFSAAHISKDNPYPWPQLLLGFYLGWVAQHNDWTLSEGVFIHAWWDVLAISATLAEGITNQRIYIPLAGISF